MKDHNSAKDEEVAELRGDEDRTGDADIDESNTTNAEPGIDIAPVTVEGIVRDFCDEAKVNGYSLREISRTHVLRHYSTHSLVVSMRM